MRRFFAWLLFASFCSAGAGLHAADVEFIRVWPGWRDAASFERIGEYFGRGEQSGREVIARTQPAERSGYYFLVRVKSAAPIDAARFRLDVIRPDAPEPKTYSFPAKVRAKETVFDLGVTGADWPGGKDASPVAWRLTLVTDDGRTLAEHKSFLWEKPRK